MVDITVNVKAIVSNLKAQLAKAKSSVNSFYDSIRNVPSATGGISVSGGGGGALAGMSSQLVDYERILSQIYDRWKQMGAGIPRLEGQTQMWKDVGAGARYAEAEFRVVEETLKDVDAELKQKPKDANAAKSAFDVMIGGLRGLSKTLGGAGKRLAWFGFRLTMIGRMFSRELGKNIKKAVQVFKNWDKTIGDIAVGMGFLASQGLLTGKTQEMMISAMQDLPGIGMQVQGVMGALAAIFTSIGADILPKIIPSIMDFIDMLVRVWEENKGKVLPILDELASETIPRLIQAFEDMAPAILTGLVEGLQDGLDTLTWFMDLVEGNEEQIANWMGQLLALAPILSLIGLGLFGASVIMQVMSIVLGGLITLFETAGTIWAIFNTQGVTLATTLGMQEGALIGLSGAIAPLIALAVVLYSWWEEISTIFMNSLMPAIENLVGAFGRLFGALKGNEAMWKMLKIITAPFAIGIMTVVAAVSLLVEAFSFVLDLITSFIQVLNGDMMGAVKTVENAFGRLLSPLENLGKGAAGIFETIGGFFDKGRVVDDLETSGEVARDVLSGTASPINQGTRQSIMIDIPINIESLSSDIDIDQLTDEISRRIADKLEEND